MFNKIKKHKNIILTVGAISLGMVIGERIGRKMTIHDFDKAFCNMADTGRIVNVVDGGYKYIITVSKELIE